MGDIFHKVWHNFLQDARSFSSAFAALDVSLFRSILLQYTRLTDIPVSMDVLNLSTSLLLHEFQIDI